FSCEIDAARIVGQLAAPAPLPRFAEDLRNALAKPLDFPPLEQAVVPGDKVCVALDRGTPEAAAIVAQLWRVFEGRGVKPADLSIVQPASAAPPDADPRAALPAAVRAAASWKIHDPQAKSRQAY